MKTQKTITAEKMRELDHRAVRQFGIPSLILMENAGRSVAEYALKMLKKSGSSKTVTVVAGKGNNGGDGLVAARHLMNRGLHVSTFILSEESELKGDPLVNFHILKNVEADIQCMKGEVWELEILAERFKESQLIVDAIFGTGLSKNLKEPYVSIVNLINKSRRPVLSVDIPSGLNADTGEVMGAAVKARLTVTLALAKTGLFIGRGPEYTGKVEIGEISFPPALKA